MKRKSVLLIIHIVLTAVLLSCANTGHVREAGTSAAAIHEQEKSPEKINRLTIFAAGDNLYHDVMIRDGENGDYESAYTEVLSLVENADIAFINQETLIGGETFGFSGYPRFNSPRKLGEAIAALGFDVVNQATNHIMDKGENAVFATMDFWDRYGGISVLGIHRSPEDREQPVIVRKNGITVGFLSYTYGTNGLPVPRDKPYLVSLIDTEIMAREIDALRPLCEFLVVSMHWGAEYENAYNNRQKELAVFLADHKVDLVIGHHPHVIQPVEYIVRPDGELMLCFYSIGNFISAQSRDITMLGAAAYIHIEKITNENSQGKRFVFLEAGAIPLVTHYERNFTGFKVYPLYSYSDELATRHGINLSGDGISLGFLNKLAERVFGTNEIIRNPFEVSVTPEPGLYR